MPNYYELYGDRMKEFLNYVFDRDGRPKPDSATFECLARIGIGGIEHDNAPFNATSFLGAAYVLVYAYDDPHNPHYERINEVLPDCKAAVAAAAVGAAAPPPFQKSLGLDKLPN